MTGNVNSDLSLHSVESGAPGQGTEDEGASTNDRGGSAKSVWRHLLDRVKSFTADYGKSLILGCTLGVVSSFVVIRVCGQYLGCFCQAFPDDLQTEIIVAGGTAILGLAILVRKKPHWALSGVEIGALLTILAVGLWLSIVVVPRNPDDTYKNPQCTLPPTSTLTPTPASTPTPTLTSTPTPLTPTPSSTPTLVPDSTVIDEELDVYSGPGEMYHVLGQAHRGDRMAILGRSEDGAWWQVNYLDRLGWITTQSVVAEVDPLAIPVVETPIPPVNRAPEVEIGAASTIIEAWGAISVTCEAFDLDGDELAYTWEASGGSITGQGDAVTYNAPKTTGGQTITVTVQDRRGAEVKRSIQVHVVLPQPPPGTFEPYGVFGEIWREHLEPHRRLGWAKEEECETDGAEQFFERGVMLWRKDNGRIYVITSDGNWQEYTDTWEEGMDESSCPDVTPPERLYIPIRGFGKVWCAQLGASNAEIGWATTPEQAYTAHWQAFEHGFMCQGINGTVYVLYNDKTWQSYPFPTNGSSSSRPSTPPQQIRVGDKVRVCTAHDRLALRPRPQLDSSEMTRLDPGESVIVVDGPAYSDGWSWWLVRTDDGLVGWVAEGGDEVDPYFICPEG
jgi:hypothetical protein